MSVSARPAASTDPLPQWVISAAIPPGARRARDQREWRDVALGAIAAEGWRIQRRIHYEGVARVLMRYMDWRTRTTRPTHDRIADRLRISTDTVARAITWLAERGLVGLVSAGSTPSVRPFILHGDEGNLAAVYVLTIPQKHRPGPDITAGQKDIADLSRPRSGPDTAPRAREASGKVKSGAERAPRAGLVLPRAGAAALDAVPSNRAEGLTAARAMQERAGVLERLSERALRHLCRPWWAAGWTPRDVLWALDHEPGGREHGYTGAVRHPAAWLAARLGAWLGPDGSPRPGRSQLLEQDRRRLRNAQAAERAAAAARRADAADSSAHARIAREMLRSRRRATPAGQPDNRTTGVNPAPAYPTVTSEGSTTMRLAIDSVNHAAILAILRHTPLAPGDIIALGYHNGAISAWPDSGFTQLEAAGIAVARIDVLGNAPEACSILDVEAGDVQDPATIAAWVRARNQMHNDAVVYCNEVSLQRVFTAVAQDHCFLWLGLPTGRPALSFPVGLPRNVLPWGHQFAWPPSSGGDWDLSVIYADDWHPGHGTIKPHAQLSADAAVVMNADLSDPAAGAAVPDPAADPTGAATAAPGPATSTSGISATPAGAAIPSASGPAGTGDPATSPPAPGTGPSGPTSPAPPMPAFIPPGPMPARADVSRETTTMTAPGDVSRETTKSPAMPGAAATVETGPGASPAPAEVVTAAPASTSPPAAAGSPPPAAAAPNLPERIITDLHAELTRAAQILPGLLHDIGLAGHSSAIQSILNSALEATRLAALFGKIGIPGL